MTYSIFPTLSMDRSAVRWEDHLHVLTPWELYAGVWFKREDFFCPLGYSGPNGSKMRQLIWHVNNLRGNSTHIVTGASIQSPQLSMTAIVGAHYGLPCRQVVYSKPSTVLSHPNPRIAAGFGAEFEYAAGPYNPIIQRRVRDITEPSSLVVDYGITLPIDKYSPEDVRAFHAVGANQVSSLPRQVTRLIVPAGSCNTLVSVLMGLSRDPGNVKELFTLGIGPDKTDWVNARLRYMGVDRFRFRWRHVSLHDTGYSSYSDKFRGESWHGIDFHPTYEAKMWRWLRENEPLVQDGATGFWIVGSAADPRAVEPFYTRKEA